MGLEIKNNIRSKENHFENLNKLIRYHDKPISTINYFLQSYIYKTMAKDNIKISISGNGAMKCLLVIISITNFIIKL